MGKKIKKCQQKNPPIKLSCLSSASIRRPPPMLGVHFRGPPPPSSKSIAVAVDVGRLGAKHKKTIHTEPRASKVLMKKKSKNPFFVFAKFSTKLFIYYLFID
jgi:hypothetical protein